MEAKKFKIGDKVRVKSLEWYNENKNSQGHICGVNNEVNFINVMNCYCGQILQIKEVENDYYLMHDNIFCWHDWMLEDEVVEDIKKRILTKGVAQAVVRCTKYILKNENENANVQKKLFEIGCVWASGSNEVINEDCKYLYVDKNLYITMGCAGEENLYKDKAFAELSVNDILNIEIEEKDMETKELTKEMTKEEVFEYLNDTKILCTSREESKNVQEKLFALGFCYYGEKSNVVEDSAFILYVNIHKKMQFGTDLSMWVEDGSRRVEPSEILAIQLKEEKPKFDPQTLQPFDKVLVRNSNTDIWRARFFDLYVNGLYETASGEKWEFCIPYNEDTKHLHYNANMAPEFYRDCEDF